MSEQQAAEIASHPPSKPCTLNPEPWYHRPWPIFWAAFALRIAVILIGHTFRIRTSDANFNFGFEAGRIARSLVNGQGYANPFNGVSGPTAWLPPLYPLLMALAFKLFGVYSRSAALFLLVVNSLFSAAIVPAVYEIAARCFDAFGTARRTSKLAHPIAVWSAWMWAAYPAALQYAIHWIWEMSLSTCLFTWTIVLALRLRRIGELSGARTTSGFLDPGPWALKPALTTWAAFGITWGLLALSNASLLLCFPAMILWTLWPAISAPEKRLPSLTGAVLACVVFAAVLTPWVLRNQRVMHAFIPTRSNLGIELYRSSLPSAGPLPWGTAMPLWPGDPEFKQYTALGEVEFAHLRGRQAMSNLRSHPALFFRNTLDRFLFFWDDTPQSNDKHPLQSFLRDLSYAFLSVCGLLGLALAIHRKVPAAWLLALVFLFLPLPYYLITVQPRFRHPLEPLIAILAVFLFRSTTPRTLRTSAFIP